MIVSGLKLFKVSEERLPAIMEMHTKILKMTGEVAMIEELLRLADKITTNELIWLAYKAGSMGIILKSSVESFIEAKLMLEQARKEL
jgi:hypothetical protein